MASHDTGLGSTAWHSEHAGHGFDAHTWNGPVADVEFPNQEILHKIAVSNQSLRDDARGGAAAYRIELVQDCLNNNYMQAVFQLQLVRAAQVDQPLRGSGSRLEGGVQLVCRYTLYLGRDERAEHQFDHILSKSVVETFATTEAPHANDKKRTTEHAHLLVHLMLFCVASARKRVCIHMSDPGTVLVLSHYKKFSKFDYAGWEDAHLELDIKSVAEDRLDNESRCIDASRSRVVSKNFMKLDDEEVDDLKHTASLHTIQSIRNMTLSVPLSGDFIDYGV